MKEWLPPQKPADLAESRLIDAILQDRFPIASNLPPERELARMLGVTRPTLREALQRLARDGWIEIHQGRSTRVRNYWEEGNLGVLSAIARHTDLLPPDFVPNLLSVRQQIAPAYTRLAVDRKPISVIRMLSESPGPDDNPDTYAAFDWQFHYQLTILSCNPIYTLILNGFSDLYPPMACMYFQMLPARQHSYAFYQAIRQAAQDHDSNLAAQITLQVMADSHSFWQNAVQMEAKSINETLERLGG